MVFTSTAGRPNAHLWRFWRRSYLISMPDRGAMATELNDSHDRHAAISPSMWMRRDRLERQFLDRVRAMAGLHLAAGDGVEGAAYELVDELREEGLRCEHMLLALKALLKRSAGEPHMLIREIVPLCIIYYYKPPVIRGATAP